MSKYQESFNWEGDLFRHNARPDTLFCSFFYSSLILFRPFNSLLSNGPKQQSQAPSPIPPSSCPLFILYASDRKTACFVTRIASGSGLVGMETPMPGKVSTIRSTGTLINRTPSRWMSGAEQVGSVTNEMEIDGRSIMTKAFLRQDKI